MKIHGALQTLVKISTPKQIQQRLPISLAQVKASNTFKNLYKIQQMIYYLYRGNEITKTVYNNTMNSIQM